MIWTLDDRADVVEEDLPALDQSAYDEVIQDVPATDTQFAERQGKIRPCGDDHLEHLSVDESLDRTICDYLSRTGDHLPENSEMTLSVSYYSEEPLKTIIGTHDESCASTH